MKLWNLDKWSRLDPKTSLVLDGTHLRKIRLEINAPGAARLFLVDGKAERFLATVHGRDVVEFVAAGTIEIATKDADVWYYTSEHEPTFTRVLDPVVFTKIAQRKARNPELEQMMFLMNQNMEKRFARQEAEYAARVAALAAAQPSEGVSDDGANEPAGNVEPPVGEPDADGSAPGEGEEPAETAGDATG